MKLNLYLFLILKETPLIFIFNFSDITLRKNYQSVFVFTPVKNGTSATFAEKITIGEPDLLST